MKKIYHLGTCSTCQRIIKEIGVDDSWQQQEIKSESISEVELDEMHRLSGSYEALFSRRAMKFRAMGLHEKTLAEADYRDLILQEYTFLKRPVVIIDGQIFIGNAKKTVEAIKAHLQA